MIQNSQSSPAVSTFPLNTTSTESGRVVHSLGLIELARGVPLAVTPKIDASVVQNTMQGRSQLLYVSEHGNPDGAWLSVPGQSVIEFDKMVYFMQVDFDSYVFPIASK